MSAAVIAPYDGVPRLVSFDDRPIVVEVKPQSAYRFEPDSIDAIYAETGRVFTLVLERGSPFTRNEFSSDAMHAMAEFRSALRDVRRHGSQANAHRVASNLTRMLAVRATQMQSLPNSQGQQKKQNLPQQVATPAVMPNNGGPPKTDNKKPEEPISNRRAFYCALRLLSRVLIQQCRDCGYKDEGLEIARALTLLESEADSHKSPTARRNRPINQKVHFEKRSVEQYLAQHSDHLQTMIPDPRNIGRDSR